MAIERRAAARNEHYQKEADAHADSRSSTSDTPPNEAKVLKKGGNAADARDMARMGRTQELQRNFKLITMFGFSAILMCSWESLLATVQLSLANGGLAGLVWTWFGVWLCFICVYLSMAEMGSMAPTTGGQYHWVSEFSPRKYQRFLSYVVGWLGVLGWQTLTTSIAFQAGTEIQGLIILNNPDTYVPQRWHGTMLVIAVMAFSTFFNTLLATRLHLVEATILVLHFYGLFCILVPLWVLSPRTPSDVVWTQFVDGGWGNTGLSTLIGMLASVLPLLGADASVHMSEELHNASVNLPRSMIGSIVVNGAMGWITAITLAYTIGNIDEVLKTSTGYAFIQIFFNSTGSYHATNAMTSIIIIMATFSAVTIQASASRQMFAFARDQGLPGSAWLSFVRPGLDVPLNSVMVSFVICCLLSCINIGSLVAYNQIVSLGTGTLMVSYIICIAVFLWRKLTNQEMLPTRFDLGRWGIPCNIISVIFLSIIFVISFFPGIPISAGLDVGTMNWSSVVFTSIVIFGAVYYFAYARKQYVGPVAYVRKLD